MKQLLEDYKRRLAISENIAITLSMQGATESEKFKRVGMKASCYRTFIAELERAIKEETE